MLNTSDGNLGKIRLGRIPLEARQNGLYRGSYWIFLSIGISVKHQAKRMAVGGGGDTDYLYSLSIQLIFPTDGVVAGISYRR